jgi:hypothetical protein
MPPSTAASDRALKSIESGLPIRRPVPPQVGLSESFVQELANEFGIRVKAFTHEIRFDFPAGALNLAGIDRRRLTIDNKKDLLDVVPEIDKSPVKAPPTPPG